MDGIKKAIDKLRGVKPAPKPPQVRVGINVPNCAVCGDLAMPWTSVTFASPTVTLRNGDTLDLSTELTPAAFPNHAICVRCITDIVHSARHAPPKVEYPKHG